jgi:hypothetical protein
MLRRTTTWAHNVVERGFEAPRALATVAGVLASMRAAPELLTASELADVETIGVLRVAGNGAALDSALVAAADTERWAHTLTSCLLDTLFKVVGIDILAYHGRHGLLGTTTTRNLDADSALIAGTLMTRAGATV